MPYIIYLLFFPFVTPSQTPLEKNPSTSASDLMMWEKSPFSGQTGTLGIFF